MKIIGFVALNKPEMCLVECFFSVSSSLAEMVPFRANNSEMALLGVKH